MQHASNLIGDIVGRLQRETMALLNKFSHDQNPKVEELRQVLWIKLEAEFKQMQSFAQSGHFIQPVEEVFPWTTYVQQRDSF